MTTKIEWVRNADGLQGEADAPRMGSVASGSVPGGRRAVLPEGSRCVPAPRVGRSHVGGDTPLAGMCMLSTK